MNNQPIGTKSQTSYIMHKYGIAAKKKYGQNFLVEPTVINKIVSEVLDDCTVIEIGAGLGALTQMISQKARKVIAYEIDDELVGILKEELSSYKNIEIINMDFLKVNLKELLESIDGEIMIVSNLPYYITTELLTVILTENHKRVSSVVAMMQKEVADRFTKKQKGKDYNALQLIAPYYCDISLLTKVNKNNFYPAPKVDSAVLKFEIRDYKTLVEDDIKLFDIVKAAFSQRRKKVLSNLNNSGYEISVEDFVDCGISEDARIEQLELDNFIKIYEVVNND